MRKVRFLPLLLSLILFILLPGAYAWAPDGFVAAREDLGPGILALLPADQTFVTGLYNAQTYFVLLEAADGVRTIYVFSPTAAADRSYVLSLQSAPLPPFDGSPVSLGSTGTDYLYLICNGGDTYYTFSRMHDGAWRLTYVQSRESFGLSPLFGLETEGPGAFSRFLPGTMPDYNLATLDPSILPKTIAEATAAIDTSSFAMVKSDVATDRLHLRASPSKQAASYGRYYSGTPVRVHSIHGGWAKVDVFGVQGYMMTEFLAFGQDMLAVTPHFPWLIVKEEYTGTGAPVYSKPHPKDGVYLGMTDSVCILANVGDDWFHVACDNGLTGFVLAKDFWPGNG